MIRSRHLLPVMLVALSAAPACADDGFMAIHMANQKIGSPVVEFWSGLSARPALTTAADSLMSIPASALSTGAVGVDETASVVLDNAGNLAVIRQDSAGFSLVKAPAP